MNHSLQSLDALIPTIRDPKSRRHADEAVRAYHGGAFRSAILSIWVAVCADLISKLRELAADGEKWAVARVTDLDRWISTNALNPLQEFERGIIDLAENEMEILTPQEARDLRRLQEDRHWCAHPAFVSNENLFSPTSEQTRAHLVHAVSHLLANPPAQGKKLVERFHSDLLDGAIPGSVPQMDLYVSAIVAKGRQGSVGTLITSLVASVVGSETEKYIGKEELLVMALSSVGNLKPGWVEESLQPFLAKKGGTLPGEKLFALCRFMNVQPRIWEWIEELGQTRLLAMIDSSELPQLEQWGALDGLGNERIRESLAARVASADRATMLEFVGKYPCTAFVAPAIEAYGSVGGFSSAKEIGDEALVPCAPYMEERHLDMLAAAIANNSIGNPYHQILEAGGTLQILTKVFVATQSLPNAVEAWGKILGTIIDREVRSRFNPLIHLMRESGHPIPDNPSNSEPSDETEDLENPAPATADDDDSWEETERKLCGAD